MRQPWRVQVEGLLAGFEGLDVLLCGRGRWSLNAIIKVEEKTFCRLLTLESN